MVPGRNRCGASRGALSPLGAFSWLPPESSAMADAAALRMTSSGDSISDASLRKGSWLGSLLLPVALSTSACTW
jgi:hypothetical protein